MTLKSSVWEFLQSPYCATICVQYVPQVTRLQSCATHQMHIMCSMPCGIKWWSDSTAIDRVKNAYTLSFIFLAEIISQWRRGGHWSIWRKPWWLASETATSWSPKIEAPNETWTCVLALVAGDCYQSWLANHHTSLCCMPWCFTTSVCQWICLYRALTLQFWIIFLIVFFLCLG